MNRNNEWAALLSAPTEAPEALEGAVDRAVRRKSRRTRRMLSVPIASAAGAAAFVLAVNLSLPFALAVSTVPVLRDLAAAVSFSDSLKAAVQNGHVQYSGQSQTRNGLTVSVQYLILDNSQVNLFFALDYEGAGSFLLIPTAVEEDGVTPVGGCFSTFGGPPVGGLYACTLGYHDTPVPDVLHLSCRVLTYGSETGSAAVGEKGEAPLAEEIFLFHLPLKDEYASAGRTLQVGRWLEVDGQRLYLDTVDVGPTHAQINLKDDEGNTAWLKSLSFYFEDETGRRYDQRSGITAIGSETPFTPSHLSESFYFGEGAHYRLVITGAGWLDKEDQWLTGLEVGRDYGEDELPGDLLSLSLRREDAGIVVTAAARLPEGVPQSCHLGYYRAAPGGEEICFTGFGVSMDEPGVSHERYIATDYFQDTIDLKLEYTRFTALPEPVIVELPD